MSNAISFCGSLGRDSEVRPAGKAFVLKFTVANNVGYGDKKTTNWFNCENWYTDKDRAEKMAQMLLKGTKVFIAGELNARTYEKDGKTGTSLDVRTNAIDFVGSKLAEGSVKAAVEEDTPF